MNEVSIELGGTMRHFRFDVNAKIDYENRHGHSVEEAADRVVEFITAVWATKEAKKAAFNWRRRSVPKRQPLEEIRGLVWAALCERPRPSIEDVGSWLFEHQNMFEVLLTIVGVNIDPPLASNPPRQESAALLA